MAAGMAAAATILPPRTAVVAMKTQAVTAMAGAQITINNQLNALMARATEMATMMTMETKATAAVVAWRERRVGGGGSAAAA
jgi:hypothetical protein